ncbi:MAG: hypothetical protein ACLU37_09270 [Collinsella sp.]
MLLGFSLGCSEFVVIGIESDLATELGISLATAGQLISVFALVYAIATPALALARDASAVTSYSCATALSLYSVILSWRWRPTSKCCLPRASSWAPSRAHCSPWA